jgi:hypothetical protein
MGGGRGGWGGGFAPGPFPVVYADIEEEGFGPPMSRRAARQMGSLSLIGAEVKPGPSGEKAVVPAPHGAAGDTSHDEPNFVGYVEEYGLDPFVNHVPYPTAEIAFGVEDEDTSWASGGGPLSLIGTEFGGAMSLIGADDARMRMKRVGHQHTHAAVPRAGYVAAVTIGGKARYATAVGPQGYVMGFDAVPLSHARIFPDAKSAKAASGVYDGSYVLRLDGEKTRPLRGFFGFQW